MNERTDKKLESVVLAQFQYRHEAEFAAGFLDDAGIPYRLVVDDAAMGMTIASPATLWVRGMDLEAARDAIDLPYALDALAPAKVPERRKPSSRETRMPDDLIHFLDDTRLTRVERLLALVFAGASAGGGYLAFAQWSATGWAAGLFALSTFLFIVTLRGRASGVLRSLLRAISGHAP